MRRLLIALAIPAGIVALLICAGLAWAYRPSVIVLRNVGDQPARLVLADADHSTQMWSGELAPGGRKTAIIWFRHEGSPELRCRDITSSNIASLDYVTGFMPIDVEIAIAGCEQIDTTYR